MNQLVKKRDKLSERIRLNSYRGALKRIAEKTEMSYGYVRQVLIIKDRWSEKVVDTAAEVLAEMDNEQKNSIVRKAKVVERALA